MWRRLCGIGVDGANAIPVERVAARIGILIIFAERGLTDEELEDFGHGGGIDFGRIHETHRRLICGGFFNAGMGQQDTIHRSCGAKGQPETRVRMARSRRGSANQYPEGCGHFGPSGIGEAPRNMPIANMRRLMSNHRLQLGGSFQLKHKSGM